MEFRKLIRWFVSPPVNAPDSVLLIRIMAGLVFFWEGVLKFVYVNQGVGRFTKLGFPMPGTLAHFVAVVEIVGGILLLTGTLTRMISFAFIIEMVVAILSTKVSLYFGTSPLPRPPAPPFSGIWAVLHEIRSDYAQLMTCLFLLVAGPGSLSIDYWRSRKTLPRAPK
jgi:putative oxidoreductase